MNRIARVYALLIFGLISYGAEMACGEELPDHIWVPHVTGMEVRGAAYSDDGKPFLVAGSNAVVTLTLDEFKPCHAWQEYRKINSYNTIDEEYSGRFKHRLKRITITGYAASPYSAYLEEGFPYSSGCLSYGLGGRYGGRNFLFSKGYESAAANDMQFIYNITETHEGSETYKIDTIQFEQYGNSTPVAIREELLSTVGEGGVFRLPLVLPTGAGFHGRYYWTAQVEYEEEGTQLYRWKDKLSEDGTWRADDEKTFGPYDSTGYANKDNEGERIGCAALLLVTNEMGWVFFDKYGQDVRDERGRGIPNWFTYWKSDGACPGLTTYADMIELSDRQEYGRCFLERGIVALSTWVGYKEGVEYVGSAAFHYPEGISVTNEQHNSMRYTFGGRDVYGIYTVEEVLTHEFRHKYIHDIYNTLTEKRWFGVAEIDSDKRSEPYMWNVANNANGMCRIETRTVEVCDKLCDSTEDNLFSEFALNKNDTDTYLLRNKNEEYRGYGDNEFLCMMAANAATRRAIDEGGASPLKDWAFPGAQTYVPSPPVQSRRSAATMANARKYSAISSIEPAFSVKGLQKSVETGADGLVASIGYLLAIESNGIGELLMHATLTGSGGTAVASAYGSASEGASIVEFWFDGKEVYDSGSEGPFNLGSVIVSEFDGNDMHECATLSEFKDPEINVRRDALARSDARLLGVAYETVSPDGLMAGVEVEIGKGGEYSIDAMLTTTGGVGVAFAHAYGKYTNGVQCVELVFESEEIHGSGNDGPYTIGSITLSKEGERIDSRLNFYAFRRVYLAESFAFDGQDDFDPERFAAEFKEYEPQGKASSSHVWVAFYPNGGAMSGAVRGAFSGDKIGDLPVPMMQGDEFLGWYSAPEGGERIVPETIIETNSFYFARWRNRDSVNGVWTVSFDARGGDVETTTRLVTDGSGVGALPTPIMPDSNFIGWFTEPDGGEEVSGSTEILGDVKYYAHWERTDPEWTIENGVLKAVDLHGATDIVIPAEVTNINSMVFYNRKELERVAMPRSVQKIGNYAFYGCTSLTMALVPDSLKESVSAERQFMNCAPDFRLLFYAGDVDDVELVNIELNPNGGNASATKVSAIKGNAIGRLPAPVMPNYRFVGWFTEIDGGTNITSDTVIDNGIVLYAHWEYSEFNFAGDAEWVKNELGEWQSGEVADSQNSGMIKVVSGKGTISFKWKVSSEKDYDELYFYIDDEEMDRISGELDWSDKVYEITADGVHTLRWSYEKDGSSSDGGDCGWVSEIAWTPDSIIPSIDANADSAEVNAIVDTIGFADSNVRAVIGGRASEFIAFKEWARGIPDGEAAVVASSYSASSYLLGAEHLFTNAPDVAFSKCEKSQTSGAVILSVTVRDGDDVVKVATDKVKAMFEATQALGDWETEGAKLNVTVTDAFENPDNSITFIIKPEGAPSSAFMRLRK